MSVRSPEIAVPVINDSGMVIPPRSIVVVTQVETIAGTATRDQATFSHIDQYGCGRGGNIMVTGNVAIKKGGRGLAFYDQFIYVSVDQAVPPPSSGEQWGPVDGAWTITRNGTGFFAQGYSDEGTPDRSMFLRTFNRAAPTRCSSSSSSLASMSGSSGSKGSFSGSSSSSGNCGCITVVTSVGCSGGSLSVSYGSARGCC